MEKKLFQSFVPFRRSGWRPRLGYKQRVLQRIWDALGEDFEDEGDDAWRQFIRTAFEVRLSRL